MCKVHLQAAAFGVFSGIIALAGGCHGLAARTDRSTSPAAAQPGEPHGPADGKWSRWLAPPPPDQPQPRFVCKQPIHRTDPVWAGALANFAWEIRNAGQAPLRVELWA